MRGIFVKCCTIIFMAENVASVAVCACPIDLAAEDARLRGAVAGRAGAAVCFSGAVRGGGTRALTLEHYPGMTENALRQIAETAAHKWNLLAARIVHRTGRMLPGDVIVFVGACSAHRAESFAAAAYMADFLKTRAPFWKKEETAAGTRWVDAAAADEKARARWE